MNDFDPITILIQLAFGYAVKHWPALKAWPNKLIPVMNLVVGILVQLAGPALAHAQAGTDGPAHPGWWAVWCFIQPVIVNTLLSTGIFSASKNVVQHTGKAAT